MVKHGLESVRITAPARILQIKTNSALGQFLINDQCMFESLCLRDAGCHLWRRIAAKRQNFPVSPPPPSFAHILSLSFVFFFLSVLSSTSSYSGLIKLLPSREHFAFASSPS
ncbi:hypothetical protein BJX70DRAFT_17519 [Aspergillus crustosus]